MQILIAIPLLLALAACQFPGSVSGDALGWRLASIAIVWGIAGLVPNFCLWTAQRVGWLAEVRPQAWDRWFNLWVWAASSLVVTTLTHWSQAIQAAFGSLNSLTALFVLGPHVVGLANSITRQGRSTVWNLLPIVVPLSTVLLIRDLLETLPFWSAVSPTWQIVWLSSFSMLVLVTVFPWIMAKWFQSSPLSDVTVRQWIASSAKQLRLRVHSVVEWHTGFRFANAMVLGCIPYQRRVLLSDVLCLTLSPHELYSVYLHEAGHIKRGHLWWRLLVVVLSLQALALTLNWLPIDLVSGAMTVSTETIIGPLLAISILLATAMLLGFVSRALEYEADQFVLDEKLWSGPNAIALAGVVDANVTAHEHLIAAIHKSAQISGMSLQKVTWLHPSIQQRIQRIHWQQNFPSAAQTAERRTQQLKILLIVTFVLMTPLLMVG